MVEVVPRPPFLQRTYSDEELKRHKEVLRQKRRNSLVGGSKIGRFYVNSDQQPHRPTTDRGGVGGDGGGIGSGGGTSRDHPSRRPHH